MIFMHRHSARDPPATLGVVDGDHVDTSLTTVRVLSTSLTLQHTYITAFAALAHSVTVTNHGPRAPDILVVVSHGSLKPQGVQNSIDQVSESGSLS